MTTPAILNKLFFEESKDEAQEEEDRNPVTKITSKLCDAEFLKKYKLHSSYSYFILGRDGAIRYGLKFEVTNEFNSQTKFREYGTLLFCCSGKVKRERWPLSKVMDEHPDYIWGKIDSSHYYEDEVGAAKRFGYIWCDAGGTIPHVVNKFEKGIVGRRRMIPALKKKIDAGEFCVSIVTFNEYRRAAIIKALAAIPASSAAKPVSYRVESFPELAPLVPRRRSNGQPPTRSSD